MICVYGLPGARSDFLLALLGNAITEDFLSVATVTPGEGVLKAHPYRTSGEIEVLFNNINGQRIFNIESFASFFTENNLYTIRIKLISDKDIVNAEYLNNYKNSRILSLKPSDWTTGSDIGSVRQATHLENIDKDLLDQYNLTINFSDLWNIDKISEIYTQVTGNTLTAEQLSRIEANITLQPTLPYPYTV